MDPATIYALGALALAWLMRGAGAPLAGGLTSSTTTTTTPLATRLARASGVVETAAGANPTGLHDVVPFMVSATTVMVPARAPQTLAAGASVPLAGAPPAPLATAVTRGTTSLATPTGAPLAASLGQPLVQASGLTARGSGPFGTRVETGETFAPPVVPEAPALAASLPVDHSLAFGLGLSPLHLG